MEETKVIASPFVPNLPALPTYKFMSLVMEGTGREINHKHTTTRKIKNNSRLGRGERGGERKRSSELEWLGWKERAK